MTITTISSREFNQDTSRAKKAAQDGPVFITDRGRPAHVLITIEEYQRLTGRPMTLAEALAQSDVSDFEFDPPEMKGTVSKPWTAQPRFILWRHFSQRIYRRLLS
jgi:prevent-host-death family protein